VAWLRVHLRAILALGAAISVGAFLSVASHELNWTDATTFVVGGAMMLMLAMFGVPLILLASDGVDAEDDTGGAWSAPYRLTAHRYANQPSISGTVLANANDLPIGDISSRVFTTSYWENPTIWSMNELMAGEQIGGDVYPNIDLHEERLIYVVDFSQELPDGVGPVDELSVIRGDEYENDLPLAAAANGH